MPSLVPKYSRAIRQATPRESRDRVDDLPESRFRVPDLLRGPSQCFLRSLSLDGDYCDVIRTFGRNRVNILRLPNLPGTLSHGCHSRIIVPLPDSMHFKTCRKASSSDDCERITAIRKLSVCPPGTEKRACVYRFNFTCLICRAKPDILILVLKWTTSAIENSALVNGATSSVLFIHSHLAHQFPTVLLCPRVRQVTGLL